MSTEIETRQMMEQVWSRRAAELARELPPEDKGEYLTLVLVRVGGEVYGLEALYVYDIRPAESITPVPRVPGWVVGVTNLRGRILSVIHPARFWNLPQTEHSAQGRDAKLVVVRSGEMELILCVDDVVGVESVPAATLAVSPDLVRGLPAEHVRGLASPGGGEGEPIVVLDVPAFLADRRLLVDEDKR